MPARAGLIGDFEHFIVRFEPLIIVAVLFKVIAGNAPARIGALLQIVEAMLLSLFTDMQGEFKQHISIVGELLFKVEYLRKPPFKRAAAGA